MTNPIKKYWLYNLDFLFSYFFHKSIWEIIAICCLGSFLPVLVLRVKKKKFENKYTVHNRQVIQVFRA